MTSRWYPGDQHCMLTVSVILQCICIVIVEAFIHNSITTKNILSSQVLITLTPLPHALLSHSYLPLSLSYSLHSLPYSLPSLPSLTQFLLCHTRSPYSILCIPIHIILSLLATPSYLSYSLPHSFPHLPASLTHSLTPLPESLSVSLILSRSLFCYSLSNSFTLVHHFVSLTPLPHSFPCLTDFASLTPSLTPLPHSLPWLTHILPVSLPL